MLKVVDTPGASRLTPESLKEVSQVPQFEDLNFSNSGILSPTPFTLAMQMSIYLSRVRELFALDLISFRSFLQMLARGAPQSTSSIPRTGAPQAQAEEVAQPAPSWRSEGSNLGLTLWREFHHSRNSPVSGSRNICPLQS